MPVAKLAILLDLAPCSRYCGSPLKKRPWFWFPLLPSRPHRSTVQDKQQGDSVVGPYETTQRHLSACWWGLDSSLGVLWWLPVSNQVKGRIPVLARDLQTLMYYKAPKVWILRDNEESHLGSLRFISVTHFSRDSEENLKRGCTSENPLYTALEPWNLKKVVWSGIPNPRNV